MTAAIVSPDGNVNIPEDIRKKLGLEHGGRIELVPFGEGQVMLVAMTLSPSALRGFLPKPDLQCSVEEMVEIAAKRAALANK
jgi:bifunctional DNA-binding transcriptional regulator/antitoxin component of YhaV-PrlF toxin-antitoxin module